MTLIILKIWPHCYDAVANGIKTCELRKEDDKLFAVGDTLSIMEWDPHPGAFTGRGCKVAITHILRHKDFNAIPEGYALLSISLLESVFVEVEE